MTDDVVYGVLAGVALFLAVLFWRMGR